MLSVVLASAIFTQAAAQQTAPATSAPPPAAAATPSANNAKKDNEVVCHKEVVLGSRMKKTVCRSKFGEEQYKDESRKALERIQAQSHQ